MFKLACGLFSTPRHFGLCMSVLDLVCVFVSRRRRLYSSLNKCVVLGIETSCDDTGCAVVDNEGNILGEALNSQQQVHLRLGGIIPPIARDLHQQHIERVVGEALSASGLQPGDLDAVAVTVKPGLPLSLRVGLEYSKQLARAAAKPLIPIHHMEAHALTIRMTRQVQFPFLVLLISGGHCLLAVARAVDSFLLLGESLDDAPGEAFDKTARRLKLRNLPEFESLSGGAALQAAAARGDPTAFPFPFMLDRYRDCNFSMAGLKNKVLRHILRQESLHGVEADGLIPGVYDLCASFQWAVARHLCQRLQRAVEYVALRELLPPERRILVVSGGVACNSYITERLAVVCAEYGYTLAVPPPHLCTDNGVMIAWNGVERWVVRAGVTTDLDSVDFQSRCMLGEDGRADVEHAQIKCKWIKDGRLLGWE
ncbi:tRNA N6-adenosine threonylcarbamoyltransferase, mitochondrial isoform X1 [Bacillus rossius redtenbacheri]|uniref:tRNA N6-adenosine threonylcarbamoyltransferase, mitochondrial isoform X1 n=1 Tax=Bacillus rossius redtenbacheri TaxID=93214 RepID=UPI002FDEB038